MYLFKLVIERKPQVLRYFKIKAAFVSV